MSKKTGFRILSALCVLTLLVGLVPASVSGALGVGFPYTPEKEPMLIEQILERDGMIDGIWYPWFDGGRVGHSLTGNEVMIKYESTKWNTVAMDTVGADEIYQQIYNLKAMGYNLLGYGGSIYDEGVVFDDNGDVLGVKQEFLDNSRRLLNMCREIGMPVMWTICFHSSSAPGYYGMDAYNIFSQKYCNPEVTEHYVDRFVRPVCEMLAEYKDIVALVAIADEPENEMNDSEKGNHFDGREMYGVNRDDLVHFMSRINDVVKEELPDVARTVASNDKDKTIYNGFDMDLMGHNVYHNNCHTPDVEDYKTDAPMILTEYNVGSDLHGNSLPDYDLFTTRLIEWREKMMAKGYKGGIQWAWMNNGTHARTAYYLLDTPNSGSVPNTDFVSSVGDLRHYIDDYRAAYRGEKVVLDKPVLYCNEGTGYVEWIPSRQATKVDILRSTDGGKSWNYVVKDKNQDDYLVTYIDEKGEEQSKVKCQFIDEIVPNSMYKIVVRDKKGNTAESEPNNVAGVEKKYVKKTTYATVEGATGIGKHYNVSSSYRLYSFGEVNNRPLNSSKNLLKNGSFESTGGQWASGNFTASAQVKKDSTAPDGVKSLYFNGTGSSSGKWYTFNVSIKKDTNYVFSAWIKGDYITAENRPHASIGVVAPDTGKFMYYSGNPASRDDYQIYPTAWDGEWHLRSVAFNSGNMTEVTIALYAENSSLWVDDMALFQNGDGIKYVGTNMGSTVSVLPSDVKTVCKPENSLISDSSVTQKNYWQTGNGWRNGFMSVRESRVGYGNSLQYTGSKDSYGLYYIKWVDVKPYTKYVFSFDMKVLEDGAGKLVLIDDRMTGPQDVVAFECDSEIYGTGWRRYSVEINPRGFTRVGIAVCDLGGSAIYDNIRLFETAKGVGNKDLYVSSLKKTEKVAYGKAASVTVNATGDGLKYAWYIKSATGKTFSKSSVTSKTYSTTMTKSNDGRQVYCVVTDKYGNSIRTATTTLTIKRSSIKIATQPKTTYAQKNKTAKVTVKATGDGLTYQWYVKSAGSSKYVKSSNTTSTYSVKMSESVNGRRVLCYVYDAWGNKVQTSSALIRMSATITTQPKTVTVKKNATAKVTIKAAGDGLTYTWYYKNANSSKYVKVSGSKTYYSAKMTSSVKNRKVYCVVKDKYGKTVKSTVVTLKMK